jgi:hypothetical protein
MSRCWFCRYDPERTPDPTLARLLGQILTALESLKAQGAKTMAAIDDLTAEVSAIETEITNLQATATLVVADINALIAAGNDSAAIEAIVARLKVSGANVDAANAAMTAVLPPA